MTADELKAIEQRATNATSGPWDCEIDTAYGDRGYLLRLGPVSALVGSALDIKAGDPDVAFIVLARSDIPALVAEVRRLRAALERIKRDCGAVCDEFEMCQHRACHSSYEAWAVADEVLNEGQPEGRQRVVTLETENDELRVANAAALHAAMVARDLYLKASERVAELEQEIDRLCAEAAGLHVERIQIMLQADQLHALVGKNQQRVAELKRELEHLVTSAPQL